MEVDAKATIAGRTWAPGSWRSCEALQMAEYDDKELYAKVMDKLSKVPPLVHASEVDRLQADLAASARGEKFIIQGGDCAERFVDCEGDRLEVNLRMIVQMGALVEASTGLPVVRISRIAGQYGKPRSAPTETHPTMGKIMSYKGDNINGYDPTERKWDPNRLLEGYWHSAASLNFLRTQCQDEDFGSNMLSPLNLDFLRSSPSHGAYLKVADAAKSRSAETRAGVYTAHEAMQLDLEEGEEQATRRRLARVRTAHSSALRTASARVPLCKPCLLLH